MKQSTIKKYIRILSGVKESGKKLSVFCEENNLSYNSIVNVISSLKKQQEKETEEVRTLLSLYNEVIGKHSDKKSLKEELIDTDDKAETSFVRDENQKIKYYSYQIYRRNKAPLSGRLTREEMNTIHRLYSYYGDALTQRVISRHFVDLSLVDFKRILRAFNITKASAPFAPHMIEECSEEELRDIQLREKENSFLRKVEEDQIKNNEKLLKKYAQENIELKRQLKASADFTVSFPKDINPLIIKKLPKSNKNINLYLADLHLGATVTSGAMYKENIAYGFEEAKRRLSEIFPKLHSLGHFDTVNVVLMGDNVDCTGIFGKTSRMDHDMPENMDAREQANKYIELILWFIGTLATEENKICSKINVYSVPCGNHRI